MKPLYFIFIALLSLSTVARSEEGFTLKTYPVFYTDIAEATVIIPLMMPSTNGLVLTPLDRKLIVRGTAEQHQIVGEILRDLDGPPKNIQVNVQINRSGKTSAREAGFRPLDPIIIRDGEIHGSVEGRFSNRRSTTKENATQMLVAMDGRKASIRVGETVPQITWLTEYAHHWGYVREVNIEWRDVGSFLAMEPTIVSPGVIRIKLTPELSGRLENGDRQRIQFTHLATEVIIGDGQTLSIGGVAKDKDFASRFFIGRSRGENFSMTDITLTPHILK